MSDIDIERLRLASERVRHGYVSGELNRGAGIPMLLDAARFLLDLADEGGELWMEKKCPHGMALNYGHDHFLDGHCDGGSRVRVWPKGDR